MHENTKNHHTVPFWLKFIHTLIAVFFMACIAYVLYCGITGVQNIWLWLAIGALAIEIAVFMLNGQRCPMTNYAERYAPPEADGFVGDTLLPRWVAMNLVKLTTPPLVLGLVLVFLRWVGV
jgi:hypothetical protein